MLRLKIVSSSVRVTISLSSLWLRIGSDAEIVSLHVGKGRTSGGERIQQVTSAEITFAEEAIFLGSL